jgi:hypothetical protein
MPILRFYHGTVHATPHHASGVLHHRFMRSSHAPIG